MPTTRSLARAATNTATPISTPPVTPTSRKRKAANESVSKPSKIAKPDMESTSVVTNLEPCEEDPQVPAILTFDFENAKHHLIEVDNRFEDLFIKMKCQPFEHLEQVHPFRALATSILGQQISWLAARSITHRFIRLFNSELPEKPTDEERKAVTFFPTPRQVATANIADLRTAGLSGRKAEYIQDLAQRFADGRLSTSKLLDANDEELAEMLTEVRGIGKWTVDMFAIFSLRRPDILPVGDLGIQRGIVRWFLSLHSPDHPFSIAPEKITNSSAKEDKQDAVVPDEEVQLSQPSTPLRGQTSTQEQDTPLLPPLFTPSIKSTLSKAPKSGEVTPLPDGLTVQELKSRLNGKKKIKGALLAPGEMTALTESWKPYRSLGVYYMWSLAA